MPLLENLPIPEKRGCVKMGLPLASAPPERDMER
jgi:hypothetical protein